MPTCLASSSEGVDTNFPTLVICGSGVTTDQIHPPSRPAAAKQAPTMTASRTDSEVDHADFDARLPAARARSRCPSLDSLLGLTPDTLARAGA